MNRGVDRCRQREASRWGERHVDKERKTVGGTERERRERGKKRDKRGQERQMDREIDRWT